MKAKIFLTIAGIGISSFFVSESLAQNVIDTSMHSHRKMSEQRRLDSLKNAADDAKRTEKNAKDASDETRKALNAEKKAQKAREQADEQNRKAAKAKEKSESGE